MSLVNETPDDKEVEVHLERVVDLPKMQKGDIIETVWDMNPDYSENLKFVVHDVSFWIDYSVKPEPLVIQNVTLLRIDERDNAD